LEDSAVEFMSLLKTAGGNSKSMRVLGNDKNDTGVR
jgi:hypothetical protein